MIAPVREHKIVCERPTDYLYHNQYADKMKVVSFNAVQQLVNIPFDMTFIYAVYIKTSSIQQTYKIANGLYKSLNVGEGLGGEGWGQRVILCTLPFIQEEKK